MNIDIIGFTGTRSINDISSERRQKLIDILRPLARMAQEFHHGDCDGADTFAHCIAARETTIVIHPPKNPKYRSYCAEQFTEEGYLIIELKPRPYLIRNHAIVDESDLLIALPKTLTEELRSGTWSTIRYARTSGTKVLII